MGLAGRLGMDLLTVLVFVTTPRGPWSTEFFVCVCVWLDNSLEAIA